MIFEVFKTILLFQMSIAPREAVAQGGRFGAREARIGAKRANEITMAQIDRVSASRRRHRSTNRIP